MYIVYGNRKVIKDSPICGKPNRVEIKHAIDYENIVGIFKCGEYVRDKYGELFYTIKEINSDF